MYSAVNPPWCRSRVVSKLQNIRAQPAVGARRRSLRVAVTRVRRSRFKVRGSRFGLGCWMLDVGCWMFSGFIIVHPSSFTLLHSPRAGGSGGALMWLRGSLRVAVTRVRRSRFKVQGSRFKVPRWMLDVGCSMLDVFRFDHRSSFIIHPSAFPGVRVALGTLWGGFGVALVEPWGGFGVPIGWLSTSLGVALEWPWGGLSG